LNGRRPIGIVPGPMPESNESKLWFPAKKFGWGWGLPTCWQGWAVYAAWLILLVGGIPLISRGPRFALGYAVYACTLGAGLIAVCWAKGEKPRWHWGKD